MKKLLLLLAISLLPSKAFADTRIIADGCLKYLASGKVYQVPIRIVDGEDLWPKYS